jgi:3-methyladenine DNA glycosylase AlkD
MSNSNILNKAKLHLNNLKTTSHENHIKTSEIRSLSAKLFKDMKDKSIDVVFAVCEEFLNERNWALGVIAFDFAYRVKNQYNENTFNTFESWLERFVRGWGDCDDFCTHAFGSLIIQRPELFEKTILWIKRDEFWMRRAAAVILIPAIHRDKIESNKVLKVADALITDEHDLVRKGYGWMLKVLATRKEKLVFDYLMENMDVMPRVSFRYALEKMPSNLKNELMRKD